MTLDRRLLARSVRILATFVALTALLLGDPRATLSSNAEAKVQLLPDNYHIDFSSYPGGSVQEWLKARDYKLEKDAKNPKLLRLSITDQTFYIEAEGRMTGFILNDSINLKNVKLLRLTWGIKRYPKDVSYTRQVNNEALMLYIFFGSDKISSGHVLIPNSPYFIGLFLCQDDRVNFPYRGRYFHEGGRFVCLGQPRPDESVVSEFDLDQAFRSYFGKATTPGITGIGFGIDTSKAGDGGRAAAFIKSIQFINQDGSKAQ